MTSETPRHIVLIGMMGVGKSTIGNKLATAMGRQFLDLDAAIEQSAERTIAQIFASDGEHGFRDREAVALREAVASSEPLVIATGGGIVDGPAAGELDRQCCVWLTARLDTLVARVGAGQGRPLLSGDIEPTLTDLMARRAPNYEKAATLTVAVDNQSVSAIVANLCKALETLC